MCWITQHHATSAEGWHRAEFMCDRDEQLLSLSNNVLPEIVQRFQGAVFQWHVTVLHKMKDYFLGQTEMSMKLQDIWISH